MTAWQPAVASTTLTTLRVVRAAWWRMGLLLIGATALSSLGIVIALALLRGIAALSPAPITAPAVERAAATYGMLAVALQWLLTIPAVVMGQGAAVLVATDAIAGRRLALRDETLRLLRCAPRLFGGFAVYALGIAALVLVSAPTVLAAQFAAPLGVVALALHLLVRPLRRRWWLWLTLFLLPFGLPLYYGVRWSMWPVAVVADGAGAVASVRASHELTRNAWLLAAAVIGVGGAVVFLAQTAVITALAAIAGVDDPATAGGLVGALEFITLATLSGVPFALIAALYVALRSDRPTADPARAERRRARR